MPKHLLVADDSVTMQKVVQIALAREDVRITAAFDADEALAVAKRDRPDVVFADAVMPGRSGYDLCAALKGESSLSHIPVIIMAGTGSPYDDALGREAGADGSIVKPFETQVLIDKVKEVLAQAPAAAKVSVPQVGRPAASALAKVETQVRSVVAQGPAPLPPPKAASAPPPHTLTPAARSATPLPIATPVGVAARIRTPAPAGQALGQAAQPRTAPPPPPFSSAAPPLRPTPSAAPLGRPPMIGGGRVARLVPTAPAPTRTHGAQAAQAATSAAVAAVVERVSDRVADKVREIGAAGPEYAALAKLSREIIEQIAWEVVPELAEVIIRSELDRLAKK